MSPTDPALILAQWMSPAFPVGAFAFSQGLEAAIEDGRLGTAAEVEDWLRALLEEGSGRSDAVFLAHAHQGADLAGLTDLCLGFCAAAGRVLETREQGASFARTLRDMHGLDLPDLPYPIAVGRAAALQAIPLDMTLRFYLSAFTSNLISAAVRRIPLGQTDGQAMLARLHPVIEAVAADAPGTPLDDLSATCFAADIAAMQHETLYSKTFRT
jgi:urease accessory protein